jgi:plastocyanin
MLKTVFGTAALCLAILAPGSQSAYAQGSPEVIVRQGDTIEWVAVGPPPHKVRFGAGAGVTSVADMNLLVTFTPALTIGPGGEGDSPQSGNGPLLTAKVKDDAAPGKSFVFNCGVHSGGPMISLPFTIAAKVDGVPPRTHKIIGEQGLHWHLHVDTTP